MQALVSIITPTFNAANFLAETIQSVQKQTHENWELFLIDDCSTDETVAIAQEFCKNDSRIQLVQLTENSGAGVARNKGIEQAKGTYITFIDADDLWFTSFIETNIKTIQNTQIPFVFSSYKRTNEKLEYVYSDFIVPNKVTYSDILKSNSISCLTAFIDLNQLGKKYMPLIRKRQDMGLWLQYLKEIPFAFGIQEPQAIYRIRENSLSRQKSKLIKYQWEFYRKIEKLSFFSAIYYMFHWMYRGFMKYRN